ncbi:cytochrome P450 family protein [Cupriavidus pauculus]|uniref:cytochrome P450 n=1 Tax=Cupriavidus pauculus TaxID=82633 RepID=UPI00203B42C9|nr:cytochrome P450 [Cupriavidus pauculus]MCM3608121.1 cytochrome P450 [Cupriavidus pauculus]
MTDLPDIDETAASCCVGDSFADPADPLAAVTHRDPYPYYRRLVRERPFYFDSGLKLWVASSADAVREVLDHPDARVRPLAQPVPPALAGSAAGDLFGRLIRMNDGAAHAALKAIVLRRLSALDPDDVHARAEALAARLPRMTSDDAHEATRWMFSLPVLAVADLLGLPLADDEAGHVGTRVAGFVATFATAMSPLATPAEVEAGVTAARWLTVCVVRDAPGVRDDGLLAALTEDAALARIDPQTLAANAVGLMIQACEATAGLIGNTLVRLGREAANTGAMVDMADLPKVVAQVARFDPPVQNTRRFMAADATLCGHAVKANDAVLVLLAAAAHDPAAATAQPAWTFGAGRHGCPGHALAQVLATCTVQALLARDVQPALLARAVCYRPSVNARIPCFLLQPSERSPQ